LLLTGYVRRFNCTHRHQGHLFQGRYKAILCDRDSYLLELVRYIHLNLVRAGLVKRHGEWLWSGHGEYMGQTKAQADRSWAGDGRAKKPGPIRKVYPRGSKSYRAAKEGNSREKVSSWEIEKLGTALSTGENPLPLGIALKSSH